MGLYTRVAASLLFPIHERLKGHDSVDRLRTLERSQWWTPERIAQHQLDSLRRVVATARRDVPYYRRIFDQLDMTPENIKSLVDLARIPLLTKAHIRANLDALKSERAGPLKRYNTGGSSGEPLIFFMGKSRISHDVAAKWRATRWWNVDIGDPEIVIWGSPIEVGTQDRIKAFRDRVLRTHLLPAFEMSAANLAKFVAEIRRIRPRMIFGYPSALAHIAGYARDQGVRLDDLGVKVAFVTSERLYDHQRTLIQDVLGCPVANGYGGRDAGFIAHECPSGNMHISAEDIIVETVDEGGKAVPSGRSGEIVVTHLATDEFPFIRYRTGDVGVIGMESCACGRGLPILKEVQGRTTDFVVAQDGTVLHGLALIYVIRDLHGVKKFKIIQERLDLTRVLLVTDASFDKAMLGTIEKTFKQRLGEQVTISVELVADVPPEKSGKYRYVTSMVPGARVAPSPTQSIAPQ